MLVRNPQSRVVRPGFTLMEMMAVVAIIVALAGIGIYYYSGAVDDGLQVKVKTDIRSIQSAAETYKANNLQWPSSITDLITPDQNGKKYIQKTESISDPWGKLYQYDASGQNNQQIHGTMIPDIWCVLPDGKGTICNWTSKIVR